MAALRAQSSMMSALGLQVGLLVEEVLPPPFLGDPVAPPIETFVAEVGGAAWVEEDLPPPPLGDPIETQMETIVAEVDPPIACYGG